jgi:hypothetical protein
MSTLDGETIRKTLLEITSELSSQPSSHLQSGAVLQRAVSQLGIQANIEYQQALLAVWHDLFRTGYLAWGWDLANPSPPFFHVTEQGRRTLANLSRDPANPDGYLAHIASLVKLNSTAKSYLEEGLHCYNSALYKAAAVMIRISAERVVLEFRNAMAMRLTELKLSVPKDLKDWRFKRILDGLKRELDKKKAAMTPLLTESLDSYWPAFTQQIRASRNDAGHPGSIEPVKPEAVHASLLIFPDLVNSLRSTSRAGH